LFAFGKRLMIHWRKLFKDCEIACEVKQLKEKASWQDLVKLRGIANLQFGKNVGDVLFPDLVNVVRSSKTKRIKLIYYKNELLATLRPADGHLGLSLAGARRILGKVKNHPSIIMVQSDVGSFIKRGRNVFAKHVVKVDDEIRPQDEVIIVDQRAHLLAVGRAMLSGEEMRSFKSGIAVKVRRGLLE